MTTENRNKKIDCFRDVIAFHRKFQVPTESSPITLTGEELEFRAKFMQEELDEFKKSSDEMDLIEAIDAICDLLYVAYGTLDFMGISPEQFEEHWNAVQDCNLNKIMVESAEESKRGYKFDIKKPKNWVSPNAKHETILKKYL